MQPRVIRRTVTLKEIPKLGWLWTEHGRMFTNLVRAVRAVQKDDKETAKNGIQVITVLTYEPCSTAGTAAVKALTDTSGS